MIALPITSSSLAATVTSAHAEFGATMAANQIWMLVSSTACWFAQGNTPVATAGAGSMFLPAGVPVLLDGRAGSNASIIRDAADGKASLTRVKAV